VDDTVARYMCIRLCVGHCAAVPIGEAHLCELHAILCVIPLQVVGRNFWSDGGVEAQGPGRQFLGRCVLVEALPRALGVQSWCFGDRRFHTMT
jgi:hypothetical protein